MALVGFKRLTIRILDDTETSIVLVPVAPPMQTNYGSDTSLSKVFLIQINVEYEQKNM